MTPEMKAVEKMLAKLAWSPVAPANKPERKKDDPKLYLFRWKDCRVMIGPMWTTTYKKGNGKIEDLNSAETDNLPAVRRLVEKLMGV